MALTDAGGRGDNNSTLSPGMNRRQGRTRRPPRPPMFVDVNGGGIGEVPNAPLCRHSASGGRKLTTEPLGCRYALKEPTRDAVPREEEWLLAVDLELPALPAGLTELLLRRLGLP